MAVTNKAEDIMDNGVLLKSGTGEFEMLTFSVGQELFGVNVSKVKEIIRADYKVSPVPGSDNRILGIFQPRDEVLSAIDLKSCLYGVNNESKETLYKTELSKEEREILRNKNFIICGFNQTVQGWLVDAVRDIIRLPWSSIIPPSKCTTQDESYITGIYQNKNDNNECELIQIIDFEAIMTRINPEAGLTMSDLDNVPTEDVEKIKEENIKVYVADDSKMLNKLITESLIKAGFVVTSFDDGKTLYDSLLNLEKAEKLDNVDLIVTDIEMPQTDGMQLCKLVKNNPRMANIPVLMFSSLIDKPMVEKCKSVGANGAFSKPQIGEIIKAIPSAIKDLKEGKEVFLQQ